MFSSPETFSLLENFCTGVVVHSANSEVLFANRSALDLLGLTLEQIKGKAATDPRWQFIREDFSKIPFEEFPVQLVLTSKKPIEGLVLGIIRPDRRDPVWALGNGSPVFDESGNLKYIIINFTDISERKRISQELKEVADKLRMAYEVSKIGVWNWNLETGSITGSDEVYEIAGLDKTKGILNFNDSESLYTPESWLRTKEIVKMTLETGNPYSYEYQYILPDGRLKDILAFGGAKRNHEGKIIELYGTLQDITEKKQVETLLKVAAETSQKATEIKSKFLDIAAHELRTPVTAFSLLLQTLKKKMENGQTVDLAIVDRLIRQSDRISKLVVELLDVSRLDRGIFSLKMEKVDIVSIVNECLDDFFLRYPERKIVRPEKMSSIVVNVDPVRILQVLSNLVDNAFKHTPDTSIVQIELKKNQESITVSVIDHGEGIDSQFLKELFLPFSRGSDDLTEKAGGLGLGLYISKEIISLHGGTVGVESNVGQGSRFYFTLPLGGC